MFKLTREGQQKTKNLDNWTIDNIPENSIEENYSEQTWKCQPKTVKGIRKLVVFLTWNELELNLLKQDEIFNESLILAQDERWRRA